MNAIDISDAPNLKVAWHTKAVEEFDANKTSVLYYETKSHKDLPHIVKFSGGRTSGMLLFVLLEAGLLKAERGDVVVFNNTSAEHPETYEFVRQCQSLVEQKYKIPFFWIEYQTYEDARNAEYTRLSSFRLVNNAPVSSKNPDGYHWRGEVFEEMLSLHGYVPTLFQRTCTKNLKLECTRSFLGEWLASKDATERLGHFWGVSQIEDDALYQRHLKNQGSTPRDIFLAKKKYIRTCSTFRPSQKWADFSAVAQPFSNAALNGKTLGRNAYFGEGGIEYLAFIGLRYDEMRRVINVQRRNAGGPKVTGYEGEHVYMPFNGMKVTKEDVNAFWKKQTWGLGLDVNDNLSNCTYCFLKGLHGLQKVHDTLMSNLDKRYKDTPCDVNWWVQMEEKYGRDMKAERREVRTEIPNDFIGFFGVKSGFSYKRLATSEKPCELNEFATSVLPCDCTD